MKKLSPILLALLASFIFSFTAAQTGPGGVGTTDGSSTLEVWLQADQNVFNDAGVTLASDGQTVQQWNDLSGNGFNASQLTAGEQPSFQAGEINGLPVVRFDGSNDSFNDDYSGVGGITARTVFVVYKASSSLQQTSDLGQVWGYYQGGAHVALDPRSGNLRGWSFDGNGSNQAAYAINGNDEIGPFANNNSSQWTYDQAQVVFAEFNAQRTLSRQVIGDLINPSGHNYGGDIAEIIVFSSTLPDVQRLRVHNYLSSKYSLALGSASNAFFTSGDPAYDQNMIVIGRDAAGYEYAGSIGFGGGLYMQEANASIDVNDEYIIAGHDGSTNEVVNTDVAVPATSRWSRSWYVERSQGGSIDAGNIDVTIGFDFTEAGMGAVGAVTDYKLLYRPDLSSSFTLVSVANATVVGNAVEFEVANAELSSGYYTLGTPGVTTLYSYVSGGDWDDADTWTTDPSGTSKLNPAVPGPDNKVVILNGIDVTISANAKEVQGVEVREGATLEIGNTTGHLFNIIKGTGKIRLSNPDFPSGTTLGPDGFGSSDGGIVEFYGTSSYTISAAYTFNDVMVNLTSSSPNDILTLLADLNLNGDLDVTDGELRVGDNSSTTVRSINVNGDIIVGAAGRISVGTANAYHQLAIGGDFTNHGTVRFTNQASPDYTNSATTGVVEITYNNDYADQYTYCYGTTDFYRIIIDKGVDATYMASFEASSPGNFELYGRNNQSGASNGTSLPAQALALHVGTIRIGPNVYIDELKSGSGNYDLNVNARIWVDNGRLTMTGSTALVVYGTFKVSGTQALVNITSGSGFTLRETGTLRVEEGTVNVSQIRTSVFGAQHVGAYIQSGGSVNLTGSGTDGSHYVFTLPYRDNIFRMSGGTLTIQRSNGTDSDSGGIFINSDPINISVTAGDVRFEMATGTNFKITSTAPFFNLYMAKTGGGTSEVYLDGGTVLGQTLPAQPLVVLSQLRIENSTIFNARGVDVHIGSNLRIMQSGAEYITGNNTTYFDNNRNSIIYMRDAAYQQQFYNLVVNKTRDDRTVEIAPHGSYATGSTAVIVNNDFSVIRGDFNYSDYKLSALGDINLAFNVVGNTTGSLDINNTSGDQTITVTAGTSPSVDKLNINKASGDVNLAGAGLAVGDLSMVSGKFNIGTNKLTVTNALSGAPFSVTKMIQTAGNASDGGLELPVTGVGTVLYPLGTNANADLRYTPATLTVPSGGFNDDGFVRISVADTELPTLAATGSALTYYWRVSHSGFTSVPTVQYTFNYSDTDDNAANEVSYVPGSVLNEQPFTRSSEVAGNINTTTNILTFDNNGGGGFPMINASYTAGTIPKFAGAPDIFYSRRNDNNTTAVEYNWSNVNAWSTDAVLKHGGAAAASYPQAGDVAVIGYGNIGNPGGGASATGITVTSGDAATHRYSANADIDIAALVFDSQSGATVEDVNLSRLTFPKNRDGNLGAVSGDGEIHLQMGTGAGEIPDLTGDFGDFTTNEKSSWLYNLTENGQIVVPSNITEFPSLRILGGNSTTFNRTLILQNDITARKLLIDYGGTLQVEANLTVTDTLQLGTNRKGRLLFSSASSQTVRTGYLRLETAKFNTSDNANLITVDNTTPAGLEHRLIVENNIDIIHGDMDLWSDNSGGNNAILEIRGENMDFTVTSGAVPELYRLIIDTKNETADFIDFNDEITLNGPTDGSEKALEIIAGRLRLLDDNLDFTLSSGGDDFVIPDGSMIVVRQASTVRVTGDDTGIRLDGELRVRDNGHAYINGGNNNYIEYSGSNQSILNIWESGEVIVGSHIRRSLLSDDGALKFNMGEQGAGTPRLVVGQGGGLHSNRGIFEVLGEGSIFQLHKGEFIVANEKPAGSTAALFLEPETSYIDPSAVITIGGTDTNAGQEITINSAVELPNLIVDNSSGNNPVASLMVRPLTLNGDLSIEAGATFDANSLALFIEGDMTNNGTYLPNGNTTYFSGSTQSITGNTEFYNLQIDPSVSVTLQSATDILVSNDLTLQSGQFIDGGNTIEVKQDIFSFASHISSGASGGILMSGTNAQTVSGTNGTFGRLELDNNDGAVFLLNTSFAGNLTLTNGILDIRNRRLQILASGNIEGAPFNINRMITTTGVISDLGVTKSVSGTSGNFFIPLGVNGTTPKYTPVAFNISTKAAGTSQFNFKPIDSRHPTVIEDTEMGGASAQIDDQDNVLQYYWQVSSSNISNLNATMALTYDPTDISVANGKSISDYVGARLDASDDWTFPGNVNSASNQINFTFANSSDLSRAYSAGVPEAFPATIPVLRAVNVVDSWDNVNNWENVTDGTGPGVNIPAGGPSGVIVEIPAGLTVSTNGDNRAAYKTIIDGTLNISSTDGHILGEVSGSGTLATNNIGYLPAGNYSDFSDCSSGGTFEFGGSADYQLVSISIPDTVYNLSFSGAGQRQLRENMTVCNDLSINGTAAFGNYGGFNSEVRVLGDILLATGAGFQGGSGSNARIILAGSSPQQITGNFTGSSAFNNLEIDNNTEVVLNGDVEVSRELALTDGKFITTSANLLTLSTISAYATPTNGSNSSYVEGPMGKLINNGSNFTFPVGKDDRVRNIGVKNTNTTGSQVWIGEYFNANPQEAPYGPDFNTTNGMGGANAGLSDSEYWSLEVSGGTGQVILHWDSQSGVVSNLNQLRVMRWNSGASEWTSEGNAERAGSATSGYLVSNAVGFSQQTFTLGATDLTINPLPVTLVEFAGRVDNQTNILHWITSSELNNDYFELQRSRDGKTYETIAEIRGNGTSGTSHFYSYRDKSPYTGRNYYRLKQVDFNGEFTISDQIVVLVNKVLTEGITLEAYPNPTDDSNINLNISTGDLAPVRVRMMDVYGRVYFEEVYTPEQLLRSIKVEASERLKQGVYIVLVEQGSQKSQRRVVINR